IRGRRTAALGARRARVAARHRRRRRLSGALGAETRVPRLRARLLRTARSLGRADRVPRDHAVRAWTLVEYRADGPVWSGVVRALVVIALLAGIARADEAVEAHNKLGFRISFGTLDVDKRETHTFSLGLGLEHPILS